MTETTARRRKGEGSVGRFHNHPTCPPAVDGVRPEHDCQGPYRAMVWVATGPRGQRKRVALYGRTEAEALAKAEAKAAEAPKVEVAATTTTVGEWLSTAEGATGWWAMASPTLKPSTRKAYASVVNRYLIPALGHHTLTGLQPDHVSAMYEELRGRDLGERTVLGAHRVLRRALLVALREGLVARNVCDVIDPPRPV